jgi:glycine dehydrogenase subunit 1
MGSYIPNTRAEREEMLRDAGYGSFAELYADVPAQVLLPDGVDLPAGKSELEVGKELRRLAGRNKIYGTIFRGAGAYNHYIPAIVKSVASKEEFIRLTRHTSRKSVKACCSQFSSSRPLFVN